MRSLIALLLLVVVFLVGMVVGGKNQGNIAHVDQNSQADIVDSYMMDTEVIKKADILTDEDVYLDAVEEEVDFNHLDESLNDEASQQSMQKIAAFFEGGAKIFYNGIVDVLYQMASLFV